MLTLYHGLASTCSKKVRMCLAEKGLEWESRLVNLQKFEQHDPEYLRLNPNGVVPTLVHDGRPVAESTVIIEYIDDTFPAPSLKPADSYARATMRLWEKWSDDVGYSAVYVPTWDRLSRPAAEKLSDAELDRITARVPTAERRARWRQVARGGFSTGEMDAAYEKMTRTFARMEGDLAAGPWLAGDMFTLADIAMAPFVERMMDLRGDLVPREAYPAVYAWFDRLRERPSFQPTFFFGGQDARTGAVASALRAEGVA
jgi:glutathione S-transferase